MPPSASAVIASPPSAQVLLGRPVRILVADDQPVVRLGIRNVLLSASGFGPGANPLQDIDILAELGDGEEALAHALRLQPDILLLDLNLPRLPGMDILRALASAGSRTKPILLTSAITTQQVIEALQLGARGIVLKRAAVGDLTQSIRCVLEGDYWIEGCRTTNLPLALRDLNHQLLAQPAAPPSRTFGLTPRELEVVRCIVEGCSNKDVARQFGISEETVKRHLSNIFDKTGVSTRLELALFAIAHKLALPDA
jgi:DNA-binding NarL/FixJ family response regulator